MACFLECEKCSISCINMGERDYTKCARDSAYALCKICVTACNACADECSKHASYNDHCAKCAAACKACAIACASYIIHLEKQGPNFALCFFL